MRLMMTGGRGFIGSALVRRLVKTTDWQLLDIDRETYAARPLPTAGERYQHIRADINDREKVGEALAAFRPHKIIHMAAETHVDRSIADARAFIDSNINGTFNLLEEVRAYFNTLAPSDQAAFRFIQLSTDEVFGDASLSNKEAGVEPYNPSSPYAASKAAADHLARAWARTFGLPVLLSYCSNNYGPGQYPEKLIPLFIGRALKGLPLPVYGDGAQQRKWLHVDDHAQALKRLIEAGEAGQSYCIAGADTLSNLELVRRLCRTLDQLRPVAGGYEALITHCADRPGHDVQYAMTTNPAMEALGWKAKIDFEQGLTSTVQWYLENPESLTLPEVFDWSAQP